MWRYERADYKWLLLADPPVCGGGNAVALLNGCERRRRAEVCLCRFNVQEIVEDLTAIGQPKLGDEWLTTELEARDVEDFRDALRAAADRAASRLEDEPDDDLEHAVERIRSLVGRLDRLVQHESGLSDQYADDVDE